MQRTRLGSQGLVVSGIGLGCMGMSVFYGASDDARSIAAIRRALDRGITFFDSADFYGAGHNERLLATAFAERRGEVVISIKSGLPVLPGGGLGPPNGRPDFVQTACEASLARLGVDAIDLYCHARVDPRVPIEETIGAMSRLVEQGKVRFVGLSEAGPETIRRAHAVHPISALQTEYSLFAREPEEVVLPLCRELGIGFVASSPLGRGILTGAIRSRASLDAERDIRPGMPWYAAGHLEANLVLVDRLAAYAAERGVSASQVALAWLVARGVVPIPGTRNADRVDENVAAGSLDLSEAACRAIEALVPPGAVLGRRRSPERMVDVAGR